MMHEKKPIRKHSKPRRFLMNAKYYSVKGLRLPIGLIFLYLACVGIYISSLYGYVAVACFHDMRVSPEGSVEVHKTDFLVMSAIFLCFLIGDYILYRVIRAYVKLPKGHLLNPLPPVVEEILPEAEVLVRASAPANSATLLRAASGNQTDDAPAVLLRAAHSETAE